MAEGRLRLYDSTRLDAAKKCIRGERWKPVVGYEGFYEVSSMGRVRSMSRFVKARNCKRPHHGKMLILNMSGKYPYVTLSKHGKFSHPRVHNLVLTAFKGPRPLGLEARHMDGINSNVKLSNLRWDTHQTNMEDKRRHGTQTFGETHPTAKLTNAKVKEMRAMRASGVPRIEIARAFDLHPETAYLILRRKTWAHV